MFWRPWASVNFCDGHLRPAKQLAYVFECAALTAEVVNFGGCHGLIGNSHHSSSYRHRSERDAHATLIGGPDAYLNPVIALALDAPTFITFSGLEFHLDAPAALRNALTKAYCSIDTPMREPSFFGPSREQSEAQKSDAH
jgi:hypothetical protein